MTKQEFIERMKQACIVARQKGADFNEPVVTAQGALESSWGNSGLCVKANNLFGIRKASRGLALLWSCLLVSGARRRAGITQPPSGECIPAGMSASWTITGYSRD